MDVPHLTEDEMAEIKKEALERLRPYLCDKIIADRHFDYLRSKKILTREDTEEISCRTTHRKKTGKLLDYLAENPRGLDALVESIQLGRSMNFIIAKITDEVQKVKNEKIESIKAGASCSTCVPKCVGATNDLSRTLSNDSNFEKGHDSTLLYHPEGEWSSSSSALGSMNLPCGLDKDVPLSSTVSGSSSAALPKPGDPGAPPLPDELQAEPEGACGSTSSTDALFQPLRSRSLSPP
ncbi:B-cell lymphoma/leukemia 10 [Lepisosteus oculatus]|nr:PREDICTED: B-cell lymphoma/leukemia 10 [Lepisosteus oculatus]